jgi:hypothetical protein
MSQQVICDNCGTPIDQTHPYYELHGGQVRLDEAGANVQRGGGYWDSTAAINRITLSGAGTANLLTGSQLRIYGRL